MKKQDFFVRKGPLFAQFILADEINRSPAKVQSALLEAMQEYQVTIGDETFQLPRPFFVLATQNPIEQEGTFPLPEAQVDRFFLKTVLSYPSADEESEILSRIHALSESVVESVLTIEDIQTMQKLTQKVFVDESIKGYITNIIQSTRFPEQWGITSLQNMISYGASPRGTINLMKAAQAVAFLEGRAYVVPEDVKSIAIDVLRHRVVPHYEAQAEGITSEHIIDTILSSISVP
jgi:MoxR-like ATPase